MALTHTEFNNFASHHVSEFVIDEQTQFKALWCTQCGAVESELQDKPCQWHQRRTNALLVGTILVLALTVVLSIYLGVHN